MIFKNAPNIAAAARGVAVALVAPIMFIALAAPAAAQSQADDGRSGYARLAERIDAANTSLLREIDSLRREMYAKFGALETTNKTFAWALGMGAVLIVGVMALGFSAVQRQLSPLQPQITALGQKTDAMQQQIVDLQKQIVDLQKQFIETQRQIGDLRQQSIAMQQQITRMQQQITRVQDDVSVLRQAAERDGAAGGKASRGRAGGKADYDSAAGGRYAAAETSS